MTTTTKTTATNNEALLAKIAMLEKQLAEKSQPKARKSIMKLNKSGGLYFTTPSMIAHSEDKGKDYQSGMNIPKHQLTAFLKALTDGSLNKLASEFIKNEWQDTSI